LADPVPDSLSDLFNAQLIVVYVQEDGEFIATEAGHRIALTYTVADAARHPDEQFAVVPVVRTVFSGS
jgi:hypothetical protein